MVSEQRENGDNCKIGENVKVRRFTRYTLGEGIKVKESDFAEEVASMTSS